MLDIESVHGFRWFAQFCSCARPVESVLAEASGTSLLQEVVQEIVPPAEVGASQEQISANIENRFYANRPKRGL